MRLIDADSLYDALGNKLTWLMGYGDEVYLTVGNNIRDTIDAQPTAYNVDKVVEELKTDSSIKLYGSQNSDNYLIPVNKVIEIVKHGGVTDDVCEWTLDGVYLNSPHKPLVSCVTDENYRYYYCPVCGKKIKVV